MSKIRVIDLLNKIANGEEVPEIIIDGEKYYLQNVTDLEDLYINARNSSWTRVENIILNDTIEIIEEPKKIEKISDEELEQCVRDYDRICLILDRLDEIIDYINKGE